jgi:hypothetical protein
VVARCPLAVVGHSQGVFTERARNEAHEKATRRTVDDRRDLLLDCEIKPGSGGVRRCAELPLEAGAMRSFPLWLDYMAVHKRSK